MRYLLDTHVLVWLLSGQTSRLPQHLLESITYCEDSFAVSEMSFIEIIQLQQQHRIAIDKDHEALREIVENSSISVVPVDGGVLARFFGLSIPEINGRQHADPFDRIIIATAIQHGLTLVSADTKFPWYQQNCNLQLLQI